MKTIIYIPLLLFICACSSANKDANGAAVDPAKAIKDSLVQTIELYEMKMRSGEKTEAELFRLYKTYATSYQDSLSASFAMKAVELSIAEGNYVNARDYLSIAERSCQGCDESLLMEFYYYYLAYKETNDVEVYKESLINLDIKAEGDAKVKSLINKEQVALGMVKS